MALILNRHVRDPLRRPGISTALAELYVGRANHMLVFCATGRECRKWYDRVVDMMKYQNKVVIQSIHGERCTFEVDATTHAQQSWAFLSASKIQNLRGYGTVPDVILVDNVYGMAALISLFPAITPMIAASSTSTLVAVVYTQTEEEEEEEEVLKRVKTLEWPVYHMQRGVLSLS